MIGTKSIFASKTFWANVFAILVTVAPLLGFTITPEMAAETQSAITAIIASIMNLVSIWGRIVAEERIG